MRSNWITGSLLPLYPLFTNRICPKTAAHFRPDAPGAVNLGAALAGRQEQTMELSQIIGFVARAGTTFAALPDLIAMLRRRSSVGMNPRMAAILASFQVLWVIYGTMIGSRSVVMWSVIAVCVNSFTVAAYSYFAGVEKRTSVTTARRP